MKKFIKWLLRFLLAFTGVLFVIYYWNLDQKLLAWVYTQVNRMFDRRPSETSF